MSSGLCWARVGVVELRPVGLDVANVVRVALPVDGLVVRLGNYVGVTAAMRFAVAIVSSDAVMTVCCHGAPTS